jgi:hypothetical protein
VPEDIDIGGRRRMQTLRPIALRDIGGPSGVVAENVPVGILFRLRFPAPQQFNGEFRIIRVDGRAVHLAHPDAVFRRATLVLAHSGIVAGTTRGGGADMGGFAHHDLAGAVRSRPDRLASTLGISAKPSSALGDLELCFRREFVSLLVSWHRRRVLENIALRGGCQRL